MNKVGLRDSSKAGSDNESLPKWQQRQKLKSAMFKTASSYKYDRSKCNQSPHITTEINRLLTKLRSKIYVSNKTVAIYISCSNCFHMQINCNTSRLRPIWLCRTWLVSYTSPSLCLNQRRSVNNWMPLRKKWQSCPNSEGWFNKTLMPPYQRKI